MEETEDIFKAEVFKNIDFDGFPAKLKESNKKGVSAEGIHFVTPEEMRKRMNELRNYRFA